MVTEIKSFDQLPELVNELNKEIRSIKKMLQNIQQPTPSLPDKWFNLDGVVEYDPAKRTKPTWYSMVSRKEVPYHKNGKNLIFLKSEIDEWLKSGRHKTNAEIEEEANKYLTKNHRR